MSYKYSLENYSKGIFKMQEFQIIELRKKYWKNEHSSKVIGQIFLEKGRAKDKQKNP